MRRRVAIRREFVPPTERSNAADGVETFKVDSIAAEMAAFDRLPSRIQRWLDEGPRKYSAVQIEQLYQSGATIEMPGCGPPVRRSRSNKAPLFLDEIRGIA